jgi:hypothetical protein
MENKEQNLSIDNTIDTTSNTTPIVSNTNEISIPIVTTTSSSSTSTSIPIQLTTKQERTRITPQQLAQQLSLPIPSRHHNIEDEKFRTYQHSNYNKQKIKID